MTYGSLSYVAEERKWMVQCAPHAAIMLKRVFGKINTSDHKFFLLSDTLENCRQLQWFMQRYPLEIKSGMVRLHRGAQDHCDQASLVERLLSRQIPAQAFELAEPARDYQKLGASIYLVSKLQTDGGHIRRLAESYLKKTKSFTTEATEALHAAVEMSEAEATRSDVPRETKVVSGAQTCP
jgi:hypothetical protein